MLVMKWITDHEGRLKARWCEDPRPGHLPVCRGGAFLRKPVRVGGPPGSNSVPLQNGQSQSFPAGAEEFCRIQSPTHVGIPVRLENSGMPGQVLQRALRRLHWGALLTSLFLGTPLLGQDKVPDLLSTWDIHFQSTVIGQEAFPFSALYSGANSLEPHGEVRDTFSFDVTAHKRIWYGGEFFVDVLSWQGYGLSKTEGVAGFPNGEAYRVGKTFPDAIVSRAYFRQTLSLDGEANYRSDPKAAQGGGADERRLILTIGHIPSSDVFDKNTYANDPRGQFMNWGFVNNLAWDYPADSLGFTSGAAAELALSSWSVRAGIFQVPLVSNGIRMDWDLVRAWSLAGELEKRYSFRGHPGAVRLLSYKERGHLGNYQECLNDPENLAPSGQLGYRTKYGFGINLEQQLRKDLGAFARLGWSDGKNQTWAFTDVDRTASGGLSVKGEAWRRPGDTLGFAAAVNGISAIHRQFLAADGLGITVGDGRLNYGREEILETYYSIGLRHGFALSPDFQYVANPAYNRDRGPAPICALRLHWEK